VTNLFAIAGHFVRYRGVSGPHNFLVILWNRKKLFINRNKQQDCWSRLNASRAAQNSFVGRMFVTSALDHNFSTKNPSKSSKVSKDLDCSLVSNKNFSEMLLSNGWRPGPGKVGQGGLKVLYLWHHSQKICNPQAKHFFECRLED